MSESDEAAAAGLIAVGKAGSDMRLFRAREAVRQGEGRLNAQAAIRSALEGRATALTGWSSTSLLAASALVFSAGGWQVRVAAVLLSAAVFWCAVLCVHAAKPSEWSMVGYDPNLILNDDLGTELELLESLAEGLSIGVQANNQRLDQMGKNLRLAGWLFIAAPLLGIATYGAVLI